METHFQHLTKSKMDQPMPQRRQTQMPLFALAASLMATGIMLWIWA